MTVVWNNSVIGIERISGEPVTPGHELAYFIRDRQNDFVRQSPDYPLIIGKLSFPRTSAKNTEVVWPSRLTLSADPRQIIAVRIHAPGFPSADSGPYFRLLLSSIAGVDNRTVELVYDSSRGFLLRQLVSLLSSPLILGSGKALQRFEAAAAPLRDALSDPLRQYEG